jgi:hypothetical protein
MLTNVLEILAVELLSSQSTNNSAESKSGSKVSINFLESCSKVQEYWTAAAFSKENDYTLQRYFSFQWRYLSSLYALFEDQPREYRQELHRLMDHLICFHHRLIDQSEPIPSAYIIYRQSTLSSFFQEFRLNVSKSELSDSLKECIVQSIYPIYADPVATTLGSLLYRETLFQALTGMSVERNVLTEESMISLLIGHNFNHFLFFRYLCETTKKGLQEEGFRESAWQISLMIMAVPTESKDSSHCFDMNWPNIAIMYRSWLIDYRSFIEKSSNTSLLVNKPSKIPLNISVKQLACMIRALYASGYYGDISLTAIFNHSAATFTTKRQLQISPDSLSNAYYDISDSSVIKINRLFAKATEYLKAYCYPA